MSPWIRLQRDRLALACMGFPGVFLYWASSLPYFLVRSDAYRRRGQVRAVELASSLWDGSAWARRPFASCLRHTRDGVSVLAHYGHNFRVGGVRRPCFRFFRNRIDDVLMRICDVMMSFPSEVMILAIVGMTGRAWKTWSSPTWWPSGRGMRVWSVPSSGSIPDKDYIRFAKVAGGSSIRIMMRHLLPGTVGELFVLTTLDTGSVILMISALSFLGLGVQLPTPEWGMMLNEAKEVMPLYPLQMIPAGMAILLVVAAFNF